MVCCHALIFGVSLRGVNESIECRTETQTGGGDVRCDDGEKCDLDGVNDCVTSNEMVPGYGGLYGKIHASGARDGARTGLHALYRSLRPSADVSGRGRDHDLSMSSGFDAFSGVNDAAPHGALVGVPPNLGCPGDHAVGKLAM